MKTTTGVQTQDERVWASNYANNLRKSMKQIFLLPCMSKHLGRLWSSTLIWQLAKERENYKVITVNLR